MKMSLDELYSLSSKYQTDTPQWSKEIHKPNDFYGHAEILKSYVGLPSDYHIKAVIEHSPSYHSWAWDMDINANLPAMFCFTPDRFPILKQQTNKALFAIGPLLHYAKPFLDEESKRKEIARLGKNLLFFPHHSSHYIRANIDTKVYFKFIQELGQDFDTIRICLYWRDILNGKAEEFIAHGFECVSAGHMFDPLFLGRLKSLIETSSMTASSNHLTHVGYCTILDKPHYIGNAKKKTVFDYAGKRKKTLQRFAHKNVNIGDEIRQAFNSFTDTITSTQREIVEKYWGTSQVKSPDELRLIFQLVEDMYQKRPIYFLPSQDILVDHAMDELKKEYSSKTEVLLDYAVKSSPELSNFDFLKKAKLGLLRGVTPQELIEPPPKPFHKNVPPESTTYKVVHLCSQDFGGAGKAALRLIQGLNQENIDGNLLVLNKESTDNNVKVLPSRYLAETVDTSDVYKHTSPLWFKQIKRWKIMLSEYPKRPEGLDMFTDGVSDLRLDLINEIRNADIIHFHWVSGLIDFSLLAQVANNVPIVWTLHDMNPFTGGCHYSGNCEKYIDSCNACPQLGSSLYSDISNDIWTTKQKAYENLNLTIVTPSRWLGNCAQKSKLLSKFTHHVIPNGISMDTFTPLPKNEIRQALGIPVTATVILFGADSIANKRKGFHILLEALNRMTKDIKHNYFCVCFGAVPENIKMDNVFPLLQLGSIDEEDKLCLAYNCADLFVLPSAEDNLPNTLVEAMACGVPSLAFNIGGVPDIIEHKKNGFLAAPKDTASLIDGITWFVSLSETEKNQIAQNCRQFALDHFALTNQTTAFDELYKSVLQNNLDLNNDYSHIISKTLPSPFSFNLESHMNIETKYQEIIENNSINNIQDQVQKIDQFLAEFPDFAKAYNDLGVLNYRLGKKELAFENYKKAAELDPDEPIFLKNLADYYYFELNKATEAMQIYVNILKKYPKDIDCLLAIGKICKDIGQENDAMVFFKRVLEINPEHEIATEEMRLVTRIM